MGSEVTFVGFDLAFVDGRVAETESLLDCSSSTGPTRSLVVVKNLPRSSARVAAEAPWRDVPLTMVTLPILDGSCV